MQDEFDKIVDQVNALEMEALKQGNGFVPKEEITPAEAASDVTFAVDPNLVAKATADLATTKSDLPLMVNDYVATYINFFANTQKGHNTLLHSFQRSGPLQGDDSARPGRGGRAAGPDLPGRRRIRLPAQSRQSPLPRRRHVAVYAPAPTTASRATSTWTSASIPKNPRAPTPAT